MRRLGAHHRDVATESASDPLRRCTGDERLDAIPGSTGLRRRRAVAALTVAMALPDWAVGQPATRVVRLGILEMGAPDKPSGPIEAFIGELALRGLSEGPSLVIERRFAYGDPARLPGLAGQLVALKPDVIFTASGSMGALAAKAATKTIPIVFDAANDPVGRGLVADLARPGGNLTGMRVYGFPQDLKRLQMLVEVVKAPRCVAVLSMGPLPPEPKAALFTTFAALPVARSSRFRYFEVPPSEDLPGAFESMKREQVDALAISSSPIVAANTDRLAALIAQYRLPAIADGRRFVEHGVLLTYSTDWAHLYRRAADYVSRIVNGMSPSDLPVEQVTMFELVINLKTARLLNIKVPRSLLLLADSVIE